MWLALATIVATALTDGPAPSSELPCPDPAEVESQLVRLGVARDARPEITVSDDKMRVVLRGEDGALLGSREVEAPASCAERATVAAVLVATWMGVWQKAANPAEPPTNPPKPAPAAQPVAPAHGPAFALGLVLGGGAYDGNAFALGAAAESSFSLHGPLRGVVGIDATTERELGVGPGRAGYLRPALAAGPSFTLGRGRIRGELGACGRLGILFLRGKGMAVNHRTMRALPGAGAWLRLVLAGKSLSPFLHAGGTYWFGEQTVKLDDAPDTARLPGWDAQLGVGVSWNP
jgi:hypothetical protein